MEGYSIFQADAREVGMSSFCGYPEAQLAFFFFCLTPLAILLALVIAVSLWLALLALIWFFEDIPWRGRYYGYRQMPGGGLVYSGEAYDCRCCKYIQDQLDCNYGSAVDAEKFKHKEDWRQRYPCSTCWRSGASTKQDLYKGPVKWAEGERP
jgi:hypothetical protein